MNIGWNIESFLLVPAVIISLIGSYFIIRIDVRHYGLLFLTSGMIAAFTCYLFIKFDFYVYPFRLFPKLSNVPITMVTVIPFIVLFNVLFSPSEWKWKITFYWTSVHLLMSIETLLLLQTNIIKYNFKWDFWDSYTWWWLYLLLFEWIGGLIIPDSNRRPIDNNHFFYGKLGWAVVHFVLITTIFFGGFYLGFTIKK